MDNKWAELFGALPNEVVRQVFDLGREIEVPTGEVLLREGETVQAIYLVFEGLFAIQTRSLGDKHLYELGYGELIGEMSFLDPHPASASVVARKDARVLELPHARLRAFLQRKPQAAAGFFETLAVLEVRRLRRTMGHLGRQVPQDEAARGELVDQVRARLDAFKDEVLAFEKALNSRETETAERLRGVIAEAFALLHEQVHALLGPSSTLGEIVQDALGQLVQRELSMFLPQTEAAYRCFRKPRGYAGDYFSIELIYRNTGGGSSAIGRLLDDCFLRMPAAQAVRNRRGLLADRIAEVLAACPPDRPARITSLACGPAREVFDALEGLDDPEGVAFNLVDMDKEALQFVRDRATETGVSERLAIHRQNLIHLSVGRGSLELPPQDLIYSIGLVDYFPDSLVVKLLDWIHGLLAPGGLVILGNFHPANPSKAMMDHVLEWRLIHRDEAHMNKLFAASAFARPCDRIDYEEQGINLFAECIKEG